MSSSAILNNNFAIFGEGLRRSDPRFIIPASSFACYWLYKRYEFSSKVINTALLLLLPITLALQMSVLQTILQKTLSPFHPLAKFPGPMLARVSKLYLSGLTRRGDSHLVIRRLHQKHGDVVRIGPNDLSFNRGDAVQPVLLAKKLPKGPSYNTRANIDGNMQLDGIRDWEKHAAHRKPWGKAMNIAALKGYEEIVSDKVEELVEELAKRQGQIIDISIWMGYYGHDFMGRLAFGREFGHMREGQDVGGVIHMLDEAATLCSPFTHISWIWPYLTSIPGLGRKFQRFQSMCANLAATRVKKGSLQKDLWYHLMGEDGGEMKLTLKETLSDGMLAVVAGSDTTATALSHLWYFFLRHPECHQRLREEVDAAFPDRQAPFDYGRTAEMPYLNGCINEALRLLPPVLAGLQRTVEPGSGGAMIGPYFVPEGNHVFVHHYSLMRNSTEFSPIPDTFWPDRWMDKEEYILPTGEVVSKDQIVLNRTSFLPFSAGPQACVGKNVAMNEMRAVASMMVQRFDMHVAVNYDLDQWEKRTLEKFITVRGPLMVSLTLRK